MRCGGSGAPSASKPPLRVNASCTSSRLPVAEGVATQARKEPFQCLPLACLLVEMRARLCHRIKPAIGGDGEQREHEQRDEQFDEGEAMVSHADCLHLGNCTKYPVSSRSVCVASSGAYTLTTMRRMVGLG